MGDENGDGDDGSGNGNGDRMIVLMILIMSTVLIIIVTLRHSYLKPMLTEASEIIQSFVVLPPGRSRDML